MFFIQSQSALSSTSSLNGLARSKGTIPLSKKAPVKVRTREILGEEHGESRQSIRPALGRIFIACGDPSTPISNL